MFNENNNTDEEEYDLTNDVISVFTILDIIQRRRNNLLEFYMDNLIFEDDLTIALRESLETDKQLVRTDEFVDLQKIKYCNLNDKNKTSDNTKCTICLTDFEDECNVSLTECNHLFHTECVKEWSRYKKDCPVCRKELKK